MEIRITLTQYSVPSQQAQFWRGHLSFLQPLVFSTVALRRRKLSERLHLTWQETAVSCTVQHYATQEHDLCFLDIR
jgi:hypothetical protein